MRYINNGSWALCDILYWLLGSSRWRRQELVDEGVFLSLVVPRRGSSLRSAVKYFTTIFEAGQKFLALDNLWKHKIEAWQLVVITTNAKRRRAKNLFCEKSCKKSSVSYRSISSILGREWCATSTLHLLDCTLFSLSLLFNMSFKKRQRCLRIQTQNTTLEFLKERPNFQQLESCVLIKPLQRLKRTI